MVLRYEAGNIQLYLANSHEYLLWVSFEMAVRNMVLPPLQSSHRIVFHEDMATVRRAEVFSDFQKYNQDTAPQKHEKIMYIKYNHCSLPWGLIFLFSQHSVGVCSSPTRVTVSWASLLIHWHVYCCSCSSFVHMCMCMCLSLKNYVHLESTLLEANWAFPFKSKWMWSEGKGEDYHMVEDLKEQEIC